ncbi:hypothetical protein HPP92_005633 [Vanilla planifolia]|uniref:Uncharacterized protein n=1 Tax=Vanilla planifolia TaxID=51239 RepID=A0A835VCS9_VANPL|nr:hypothetical protein HPP92_005633 [Vanilla planifolia]
MVLLESALAQVPLAKSSSWSNSDGSFLLRCGLGVGGQWRAIEVWSDVGDLMGLCHRMRKTFGRGFEADWCKLPWVECDLLVAQDHVGGQLVSQCGLVWVSVICLIGVGRCSFSSSTGWSYCTNCFIVYSALTRFRPFGQKTFGVRFLINMAKAEALDLFSEDALLMKERT